MNIITKTMQLLTTILALVALAACQPDAAISTDQATITITTLQVDVQQMGKVGETRGAAADGNTRGTRATADAEGMVGVVKTEFRKDDVLHIMVMLTEDDKQFYTATCTNGTAWKLNKPMVLPQDAITTAAILAFYDGKPGPYDNHYAFKSATDAALAGTTDAAGLTTYKDVMEASGKNPVTGWVPDGGITLTPSGALTIKMEHEQSLLRIAGITNNLGGTVTGIKANLEDGWDNEITVPLTPSTLPVETAEAIARSSFLHSFTVTLKEGSNTRDIIVDAPNYNSNPAPGTDNGQGTKLKINESYTYRLSLSPGSLTAIPTDGSIGEAPGWGDAIDPNVPAGYIGIYDRKGLEAVKTDDATVKYILMADIDLTGSDWTPIGTSSAAFTGIFNGNGHTITGMTINNPGFADHGLFGYIDGTAILYNIHMRDVNVTGGNNTAALVGYVWDGTISGCSSTGTVSGTDGSGGLVGTNMGHITRCWSTAAVTGSSGNSNSSIGGLVGGNGGSGTIVASYTQGSIVSGTGSGSRNVGGLVGDNSDGGTIFGCYAAQATVSATSSGSDTYIGALVGQNYAGNLTTTTVTSCYATNAASSSVPGNSDNKLVGKSEGMEAKFTACISPLADVSGEVGGGNGGITGNGNYAALVIGAPAEGKNVRTVVVTDGAIELAPDGKPAERTWKTTGIWGISTGASAVPIAPHIDWTYHGEPTP